MDTERILTWALALTLTAVAGFAAVVSYSHIYDLGVQHLYHGGVAYLLPLSVDGLIVYSSLVLLYAAKHKLEVPNLARLTLWLGILATVAANVAYGLPGGPIAALVSAWPAVAFICVVETGMQLAKSKRIRAKRDKPADAVSRQPQFEVSKTAEPITVSAIAQPERNVEPKATRTRAAKVEGLPRIKDIRAEFKCGQIVATDIQRIMRETNCDMHKAKVIRDERKNQSEG